MTLQRDLQLYRNELDVLDRFEIIWEPYKPYTYRILESTSGL